MKEKIPTCIESLLAIDTLSQAKTSCISIAVRICKDRVKEWIKSHIDISIFTKDFNLEVQKIRKEDFKCPKNKPVFALPSVGNRDKHDDTCLSAAHLLETVKVRNSQPLSISVNSLKIMIVFWIDNDYKIIVLAIV